MADAKPIHLQSPSADEESSGWESLPFVRHAATLLRRRKQPVVAEVVPAIVKVAEKPASVADDIFRSGHSIEQRAEFLAKWFREQKFRNLDEVNPEAKALFGSPAPERVTEFWRWEATGQSTIGFITFAKDKPTDLNQISVILFEQKRGEKLAEAFARSEGPVSLAAIVADGSFAKLEQRIGRGSKGGFDNIIADRKQQAVTANNNL